MFQSISLSAKSSPQALVVGQFSLGSGKDAKGAPHALASYRGRAVVLYFYPKDDTSACTAEACAFRDALPSFETLHRAAVLGISPDSAKSHAKFAAKHSLNFTLLADTPGASGTPAVCDAFGVWAEKSMYGKKYMGVVRTTYLIDAQGRVARRWDKVKVDGHADEVLAALAELTGAGPAPKAVTAKPAGKKASAKKPTTKPTAKKAPAKKAARKPTQKTVKKSSKPRR